MVAPPTFVLAALFRHYGPLLPLLLCTIRARGLRATCALCLLFAARFKLRIAAQTKCLLQVALGLLSAWYGPNLICRLSFVL